MVGRAGKVAAVVSDVNRTFQRRSRQTPYPLEEIRRIGRMGGSSAGWRSPGCHRPDTDPPSAGEQPAPERLPCRATCAYAMRRAAAKGISESGAISTVAPVCGACTMLPLPR